MLNNITDTPITDSEDLGPIMINLDNALNKAIVLGNCESRHWVETYAYCNWHQGIPTWGCNAIYRDM